MKTLLASNDALALLNQTRELSEIRDSQGNLIGLYAPVGCLADLPVRAVPGKHYTTGELFDRLKKVTPDEETEPIWIRRSRR